MSLDTNGLPFPENFKTGALVAHELLDRERYQEAFDLLSGLNIKTFYDRTGLAKAAFHSQEDRRKGIELALSELAVARDMEGDNGIVDYNVGTLYLFRSSLEDDPNEADLSLALEHLFASLQKGFNRVQAYINIGTCLNQLRRPLVAIDFYSLALSRDPKSIDAKNGLVSAYLNAGFRESARSEAESLVMWLRTPRGNTLTEINARKRASLTAARVLEETGAPELAGEAKLLLEALDRGD